MVFGIIIYYKEVAPLLHKSVMVNAKTKKKKSNTPSMSYLRKLELRQKASFEAFLKPPPRKEEQEGKKGQGRARRKNGLVYHWYNARKKQEGKK